jgi:dihydrolipoamide dehydrogenase
MKYDAIPNCIFTLPEIGSVGMTETAAREAHREVIIGKFPFAACGKALATGAPEGFVKIIADGETGNLLGCHIIGETATEVINEASIVIQSGGTIDNIVHAIHAHPTISESVYEAACAALNRPIHIPKS